MTSQILIFCGQRPRASVSAVRLSRRRECLSQTPTNAGGLLFGTFRSATSGISGRGLQTSRDSGSSELYPQTAGGTAAKLKLFLSLIKRRTTITASVGGRLIKSVGVAGLAVLVLGVNIARAQTLNIYTGRHYPADQMLYDLFQSQTGITVNALEGKTGALLERLRLEGDESPADLFITVDAGNLWRARNLDLLAPVVSDVLVARIPPHLRSPENLWFGFATRSRIAFYNPRVLAAPPRRWSDLALPEYREQICARSSSNIYNLSLLASFIERDGEDAAARWAQGVVANFARPPAGGDTDQLRAAAEGICGVAIANHYYYARLLASESAADNDVAAALVPLWLGEEGDGVHANISGGALLRSAKNREEAVAFLEFLASDRAQEIFAEANNEYPVVAGVALSPVLDVLGLHRTEEVNVSVYGRNQALAQRIYDRAGWQ